MRRSWKLKEEFEEYLEDLELFSDPKFWATIKQVEEGRIKHYKNIDEFRKKIRRSSRAWRLTT